MPAQLPADVHGFVNRAAELDQLDAALGGLARSGPERVCVIAGTAGVGKTSLCVHWAYETRDQFPDGQLYINLRGREATALDGLGNVYRDLGRIDEAATFHRRAASAHHDLGDRWQEAVALDHLATALARGGKRTDARSVWANALSLLSAFDDPKAAISDAPSRASWRRLIAIDHAVMRPLPAARSLAVRVAATGDDQRS